MTGVVKRITLRAEVQLRKAISLVLASLVILVPLIDHGIGDLESDLSESEARMHE